MKFNNRICASFTILVLFISLNCSNFQLNAQNSTGETIFPPTGLKSKEIPTNSTESNDIIVPNVENYSSPMNCADQIELSESSLQYKKENVVCLENLIKSCQEGNSYLLYTMGSIQLRILGLINGICQIDITHEIERDSKNFSCVIPDSNLKTWEDWKNGDGLDVLGNLTDLCSQK